MGFFMSRKLKDRQSVGAHVRHLTTYSSSQQLKTTTQLLKTTQQLNRKLYLIQIIIWRHANYGKQKTIERKNRSHGG